MGAGVRVPKTLPADCEEAPLPEVGDCVSVTVPFSLSSSSTSRQLEGADADRGPLADVCTPSTRLAVGVRECGGGFFIDLLMLPHMA